MPDQQEGRILYLHSATGKEAKSVPVGAYNIMVASPDLSRAVVWDRHSSQNRPRMVEYFTGRTLCELPAVKSGTIQFSRDGKLFAVLQDGRVMIKDASTGRDLYSFVSNCGQEEESDSEHSLRMAFSPDSRLIAIGDASPGVSIYQLFDAEEHEPVRVYIYEVETGKLLQTLTGMNGAVRALQFSPDGSLLAVGDSDDRGEAPGENAAVLLWETKSWKPLGAIAVQPQSAIAHMLFSPDGKSLATVGDRAPSVEVWPVPPLLSR
jgi:WD40 repeat protein